MGEGGSKSSSSTKFHLKSHKTKYNKITEYTQIDRVPKMSFTTTKALQDKEGPVARKLFVRLIDCKKPKIFYKLIFFSRQGKQYGWMINYIIISLLPISRSNIKYILFLWAKKLSRTTIKSLLAV